MEDVKITVANQPAWFNFSASPTAPNILYTTAAGPSVPIPKNGVYATIQAIYAGSALTAYFQGTNDPLSATGINNNWVNLATITLPRASAFLGDSTTSDGAEVTSSWRWVRVFVSSISGGQASFVMGG